MKIEIESIDFGHTHYSDGNNVVKTSLSDVHVDFIIHGTGLVLKGTVEVDPKLFAQGFYLEEIKKSIAKTLKEVEA